MNARQPIPILPIESVNSRGTPHALKPSDVTDSHGERVIPSRERVSSLAEGASREVHAEGVSCSNKQELHAAAAAAG
ncbi:MAG: hypothetical protein ACO3VE_05740, partial [Burkholderiaceae bacterium]